MKHQHYIPRCYLKNFANSDEGKHFVDVYFKSRDELKSSLSVVDVCVKKNLYTIERSDAQDKYLLEKFYAKNIDGIYPEVYDILTNEKILKISELEREKILTCCLSLYFRTPKFLNSYSTFIDEIIDGLRDHADPKSGIIETNVFGEDLTFNITEIDHVKSQFRKKTKETFQLSHLEAWDQFVRYKLESGIAVYKIDDPIDLITSDNPVVIRSTEQNRYNLFDPSNIITIPLDRKYWLTIMPKTAGEDYKEIHRGDRNKTFAITTNQETSLSAEDQLIGFPGTLEKHFTDQIKHNIPNKENLKVLEDSKLLAEGLEELMQLIDKVGFHHPAVNNRIKTMLTKEVFKNDKTFQKRVNDMREMGMKF